ncbi:MAG: hypothetical protein EXS09_07905 [Gemmataceae bacterium]|nr:hypothetical protein [Gemmataceae bacterium]
MLTILFRCSLGLALAVCHTVPAAAQRERPAGAPRPETRGVVKAIDVKAGTIVITAVQGRDVAPAETTFALAKEVEVAVDPSGGTRGRAVGFLKEGKLAELTPGTMVSLSLSADQKTVEAILAESPNIRGVFKSVDAEKSSITVTLRQGGRGEDGDSEKSYAVAKDAEIAVDDGLGRRTSVKEGKLVELATGCTVSLRLSADQKTVESVLAEGPVLNGIVKAVDSAKNSITIVVGAGRGEAEEKTLNLAKGATIVVDDGRGRRLSVKELKLADVPPGAMVNVRLSVDQNSVTLLRAEGPSLACTIKSVDAAKGTITVLTRVARGDDPVEKTLPVSKEARVVIEGAEAKFADVKPSEEGGFAMVRLSLDSKTVQGINIGRGR